ncbi:MAG: hypothetical protein GXO32_03535, partial [Crenarchaeota archaeon]|nr:hypothetical protein [Thermoproteota archaeon]
MGALAKLRSVLLTTPDIGQRVRIVGLRDEVEELSRLLQSLGLFQPSQPRVAGERVAREVEELSQLVERASKLVAEFVKRLPKERVVRIEYLPTFEELRNAVPRYIEELSSDLREIESIEAKIAKIEERMEELRIVEPFLRHVLETLGDVDVGDLVFDGSALVLRTYRASPRSWKAFLEQGRGLVELVTLHEGEDIAVGTVAFMSRDRASVESLASSIGLREVSTLRDFAGLRVSQALERIAKELSDTRALEELQSKLMSIVERDLERVALLKLFAENEGERLKLLKLALSSRYAFFVEGWVPQSQLDRLVGEVYRRSRSCVVEIVERGAEEEPPVVMRNPKPLKPFEMIPTFYGYPSPNEWDPTPIMAYSFIFFFAFILGDAGYAIGVALAARYLLPKLVENPESKGFKSLQKILYVCAFAAAVFGTLVGGCFFGPRNWVPSITPHATTAKGIQENMSILIAVSMWTGYVHMLLAHGIAAAKNRKLGDLWGFINEVSIVGLMIFGGMYIASWLNILPIPKELAHTVLLPLAIAFLVGVVLSRIKGMGALGGLLWIFDLTGPLSDVISYVRLAALDMATMLMAY